MWKDPTRKDNIKIDSDLEALAYATRLNIIDMAEKGGCFIGSAFSCIELIIFLYERFLDFDFTNHLNPERDIFYLSKGHAVPALYSYFVEKGLLSKERLANHQSVNDAIYLHPNTAIPGIEFHSGSLGHLLGVAVGTALHFQRRKLSNRVAVIVGDGELDEGSNWEALLVAAAQKLSNLYVIVDRNKVQANFNTEDLTPLEPLGDKFRAFGCRVVTVNGHSFSKMDKAFAGLSRNGTKPVAVIANTVRGRGIAALENDIQKWFVTISLADKAELVQSLRIVRD